MEYKKITEVELIEEPSENAAVLAEDNGKLRRVPFKKVGGANIPGPQGPQGPAGADGHTPVKGEDYFTEEDKTEIVSDVLAAMPEQEPTEADKAVTEEWVFTLEDGTTVTKKVLVID